MADTTPEAGSALPGARSVLAVCAHPDDESFGLGAALHAFARTGGTSVAVLCFTHGEASTLGHTDRHTDRHADPHSDSRSDRHAEGQALHGRRAAELAAAGRELSLTHVELLAHPDGALGAVDLQTLAGEVRRAVAATDAELLLVFDEGGVTGHPDHQRATEAALAAAGDLPVLAWVVPDHVADALNQAYGTTFVGRPAHEVHLSIPVDRAAQRRAIACHESQAAENRVLWRRLELLGDREAFRWLRRGAGRAQP